MPPHAPSPTPTRIARIKGQGPFGGGEIWVSGVFPDMANWMSTNAIDVQVARLQLKDLLCCPCCRIFETSTSNKFWAGVVESPIHLFISLALRFWHQGVSQVPFDDFTSSRAQVNCLKNSLHNCVLAVRAVLHRGDGVRVTNASTWFWEPRGVPWPAGAPRGAPSWVSAGDGTTCGGVTQGLVGRQASPLLELRPLRRRGRDPGLLPRVGSGPDASLA